ncbi:hypothetical protein [Rhizomonospora bruguierae]|uniref:hypothetical protein n=1 Tax=Rhizomonospora bruguierae TaxID=1581705 RepID=UPI001BCCA94D|nr:hypothetical protein [Micromonospora sp. NBRC 107566]
MMDGNVFVLGILGLLALVAVVTIWQMFATWRARAMLAREDEYRGLSARAVAAQESSSRRLDEIAAEVTQVRVRLDAIERILTVVE